MHTLAEIRPRELIKTYPIVRSGEEVQPSRSFLVISSPLVQQNAECCICVGITSSEDQGLYFIPLKQRDVEGGELEHDEQIDCKKIITLYRNQIMSKVGVSVTKELYAKVIQVIQTDIIATDST